MPSINFFAAIFPVYQMSTKKAANSLSCKGLAAF